MKVIGSGSYGCVVKPAIACDNKRKIKAGTVSKITRVDSQNREFKISKKLLNYGKKKKIKIDNYLCLIKDICDPDLDKLNNRTRKTCSFVNKKKTSKKIKSLIMLDCGIILNRMIKYKGADNALFKKIIKNILKGLEIMHNNKLIHGDIKENNILMKNNIARLIDFGGSIDITKYDLLYFLDNIIITRTYMAPELVFLFMAFPNEISYTEYISNFEMYGFMHKLYDDSGYSYDVSRNQKPQRKLIIEFFQSLINPANYQFFLKDFKKNIYKIDVYSLGKALEYLILDYKIKVDKNVLDLISNMINLDYRSRFTVKQCINFIT